MNFSIPALRPRSLPVLLALLLPTLCVVWAFLPTFGELVQSWNSDPQYSHGYLVPVFAAFLLWQRRARLDLSALRPSWWGVLLLAAGLVLRLAGAYLYFTWVEQIALLPCIAGLCLLLGGWAAWRWAWPAILFLAFMIPLPFSAAVLMSKPLQWLATICSTFCMQVLGLPALAEGNVILLNERQLNIIEACSGLRMLVVFFALAAAFVMVVRRPLGDKLFLLLTAAPIALASNVLRITLTGVLYETFNVTSETVHVFFHDAAGWLMMPLALGMLWVELKVLDRLLIAPPAPPGPAARAPRAAAARRSPPPRARRKAAAPPPAARTPAPATADPAVKS